MICYASVSYQTLFIQYPHDDIGEIKMIYQRVGSDLIHFLYMNLDEVEKEFRNLFNRILPNKYVLDKKILLTDIIRIDEYSLYLHFYTQALIRFLKQYNEGDIYSFHDLFQFTTDFSEQDFKNQYTFQLETIDDILFAYDCAIEIVINDIKKKQDKLKHELEYVVKFSKDIKCKKDLQRLYFLDCKHSENGDDSYYINHTFSSQLVPIDVSIFEVGNAKNKNIKVFNLYKINSIDEIIRFELLNSIKNDVPINQCQCCGKFFIPYFRSDTKYCSGKAPNSEKRCDQIGAMLSYKRKNAADDIFITYNKAYKRNNSRVRNHKMTKDNFYEWSELARKMRDDCRAGKISFEEFQSWLNQK